MSGLPAKTVTAYLSRTAGRAYDLDLDALAVVAERVCPTYGDVMEPFSARPEGSATSFAFREFGHWS
jgi:hypothetical protein